MYYWANLKHKLYTFDVKWSTVYCVEIYWHFYKAFDSVSTNKKICLLHQSESIQKGNRWWLSDSNLHYMTVWTSDYVLWLLQLFMCTFCRINHRQMAQMLPSLNCWGHDERNMPLPASYQVSSISFLNVTIY